MEETDRYALLLDQATRNPTLGRFIRTLTATVPRALNLITPDWRTVLEASQAYQAFQKDPKPLFQEPVTPENKNYTFQYVNRGNEIECLFIAPCRIPQKEAGFAFIAYHCPPLQEMARVMTGDLGIPISDSCRFYLQTSCNSLTCDPCRSAHARFEKLKLSVPRTSFQPCIANTRIYDGRQIVNRFASQFAFQDSFLAILHVKIGIRYSFETDEEPDQKRCRIGGVCLDVTAFHETKLQATKTVNLGDFESEMEWTKEGREEEEVIEMMPDVGANLV